MQTIPLADTDKYVRDSNSKAILSTDFQALKMYKAKRNQHKNMTRQFREFENDINSVKQEPG